MNKVLVEYWENPDHTWDAKVSGTNIFVSNAEDFYTARVYTKALIKEELGDKYAIGVETIYYYHGGE